MAEAEITPRQTQEGKKKQMTDEVAAGAILNAPKMHLYKSTFTPTPANVLADFVAQEVVFTGYAAVALTPSAVLLSADGDYVVMFNRALFAQTAVTASDIAGGFWIDDGAASPTLTSEYGEFPAGGIHFDAVGAFAGVTLTVNQAGPKTADIEY
jgi:hypothetical protein